jgi:hypothetical protein
MLSTRSPHTMPPALRRSPARPWRVRVAMLMAIAAVALGLTPGAARAAGWWWQPPQQLTWYWQLSGTVAIEPVQATDVDGFTTSAATVAALHAAGQRVICYVDAGTWEPDRPDAASFPSAVIGASVSGWPGEHWLDVRQLAVLEPIMASRFAMCAAKGFDAVEPDNIDGYANDTGFPITAQQQLAYNAWIAQEVHGLGMAILQKNDPDQTAQLQPLFDGALAEQCNEYSECSAYAPYVAAGKPVLDAEYETGLSPGFCAADAAAGIMGALYDLDLGSASGYRPCFGPSPQGPPVVPGPPAATIAAPAVTAPATPAVTAPPAVATTATAVVRDRRAPRVAIGRPSRGMRTGRVRLRLRCPSGQSYCDAHVSITARATRGVRRVRVLYRRRVRIAGGHTATISLRRPDRTGRGGPRRLIHVTIAVSSVDAAGRRATVTRQGTLRLRHRRAVARGWSRRLVRAGRRVGARALRRRPASARRHRRSSGHRTVTHAREPATVRG